MDDNKEFELEHDHIDEEEIVVITDEDGNEMYFREEMVIPVGEKSFAVLSALDADDCGCEDEECHCHDEEDDDEDNVIIARIDFDEDGNEIAESGNEADAEREAALADAGCELVEQPVASAAALGRLVRRFPIALMADESLHGPESAFEIAKAQGTDVFAIKIEQSGGLFAAQRVAAIADAAGIELYGGTMLEGAFSTIASAQLFATFAKLQWGTELFGPLLLSEEILTQPLDYSDFHLTVPNGPGLGIALDEERVQFFRRDGFARKITVTP